MIEKRITVTMLEAGEVRLSDQERLALELPPHSTDVVFEIDGDQFHAQWSGAGSFLHGELLLERMQDYGQVDGLIRLRLVQDGIRVEFASTYTAVTSGPRAPDRPQQNTRRDRDRPAPPHRTRAVKHERFLSDDEFDWIGQDGKVGFLREARRELTEQLTQGGFDSREWLDLRLEGETLATLDDFEELLAVDVSNVERMPHQEAVTRRVLSHLRGRAILADEVGLGKTIEAGLAVKELVMRGRARRVLIICPATLRQQWQEEMSTKFELPFEVAWRGSEIGGQERLILSLALAARNAGVIAADTWDVVIVDEAHRAAGPNARKTRQLIGELSRKSSSVLLLTATPVQNDLMELYELVQLLRPGTFRSASEFRREFMVAGDKRQPKNAASLRTLMNSAMVRMTRAQAGVDRVKRVPTNHPIVLDPDERDLYDRYVKVLREVATSPGHQGRTRNLSILLTALPGAMGARLMRMAEGTTDRGLAKELGELASQALNITNSSRERVALELIRQYLADHGRVLVFTQHTDSLIALVRSLGRGGINASAFHGSMAVGQRARSIERFRSGETPVLVSTDAGAEGQNLQFCNCVVNFDLPWNPMRIEQRIGRVDRLTQPKDTVYVANLFALGTIDERVYRLLAEKLRMFELLFGQVTTILGELDDSDLTFEGRIIQALTSPENSTMDRALDRLGGALSEARDKAGEFIAADNSLSSWLRTAFDHRDSMNAKDATELAVGIEERARERQKRVQAWVRRILHELGAAVAHDTGSDVGAFISARLPEEVAGELGGRTVVHLAFDRIGLDHHPDAELCAVGTPVFSELLGVARLRGDIYATVPELPALAEPWYRHSERVELVSRELVPSGVWSGEATFRVSIGEAERTERVEPVAIGSPPDADALPMGRRTLLAGQELPAAFGTARAMLSAFDDAAAEHLELRRSAQQASLARERLVSCQVDPMRNSW